MPCEDRTKRPLPGRTPLHALHLLYAPLSRGHVPLQTDRPLLLRMHRTNVGADMCGVRSPRCVQGHRIGRGRRCGGGDGFASQRTGMENIVPRARPHRGPPCRERALAERAKPGRRWLRAHAAARPPHPSSLQAARRSSTCRGDAAAPLLLPPACPAPLALPLQLLEVPKCAWLFSRVLDVPRASWACGSWRSWTRYLLPPMARSGRNRSRLNLMKSGWHTMKSARRRWCRLLQSSW